MSDSVSTNQLFNDFLNDGNSVQSGGQAPLETAFAPLVESHNNNNVDINIEEIDSLLVLRLAFDQDSIEISSDSLIIIKDDSNNLIDNNNILINTIYHYSMRNKNNIGLSDYTKTYLIDELDRNFQ